MGIKETFLNTLSSQLGYLEKATNSQLEDFTANAGKNNYTKYGAWYGLNGPTAYWCHMYVIWCANQAGVPTSIVPKTASCATGRDFFKNKGRFSLRSGYTPKVGDIVYFSTAGYPSGSGHVGVVYKVDSGKIYTYEGNTSGGSTVIDNGGGVVAKSYALSNTAIYGYGSPDYDGSGTSGTSTTTSTATTTSGSGAPTTISGVQTWLNDNYPASTCGYEQLAVDGDAGAKTNKKIIWNIQRELAAKGKSVGTIDGVAGSLFKAAWITLQIGSTGNLAKLWQMALICKGYVPSGGADGEYGSGTASATKAWQGANSIGADGIAGPVSAMKRFA